MRKLVEIKMAKTSQLNFFWKIFLFAICLMQLKFTHASGMIEINEPTVGWLHLPTEEWNLPVNSQSFRLQRFPRHCASITPNWQTEVPRRAIIPMLNSVVEMQTQPLPCQSCQSCQRVASPPTPALPVPVPSPHIPSSPCPRNYLFSCQPRVTQVPCRTTY